MHSSESKIQEQEAVCVGWTCSKRKFATKEQQQWLRKPDVQQGEMRDEFSAGRPTVSSFQRHLFIYAVPVGRSVLSLPSSLTLHSAKGIRACRVTNGRVSPAEFITIRCSCWTAALTGVPASLAQPYASIYSSQHISYLLFMTSPNEEY